MGTISIFSYPSHFPIASKTSDYESGLAAPFSPLPSPLRC
jgi:hypothetical protein